MTVRKVKLKRCLQCTSCKQNGVLIFEVLVSRSTFTAFNCKFLPKNSTNRSSLTIYAHHTFKTEKNYCGWRSGTHPVTARTVLWCSALLNLSILNQNTPRTVENGNINKMTIIIGIAGLGNLFIHSITLSERSFREALLNHRLQNSIDVCPVVTRRATNAPTIKQFNREDRGFNPYPAGWQPSIRECEQQKASIRCPSSKAQLGRRHTWEDISDFLAKVGHIDECAEMISTFTIINNQGSSFVSV